MTGGGGGAINQAASPAASLPPRYCFPHYFNKECNKNYVGPMPSNNKKRSHTQLDSRKQVIAFQDRVITIHIKEAQYQLKREKQVIDKSSIMLKISTKSMHRVLVKYKIHASSAKKHYGYNQMKPDERTKFLKWYDDRVSQNYIFDFQKEIIEYCRSDVDILRRGMMKLREDFVQLENIDPLRYITIASVCMTIYRSNYMPKKTIAIVPESVKTDNFSKMSIMWLNYVSNGVNIQHALNGGEKKLTIDNKTYKSTGSAKKPIPYTNSMVAFGMDVQNATGPIS